jgi:hypothetical protein
MGIQNVAHFVAQLVYNNKMKLDTFKIDISINTSHVYNE